MTRVQTPLQIPPSGCTVNPVLKMSDGTPSGTKTITITGTANDSGTLLVNFAAGVPITVSVSTASRGCSVFPALANMVAQYKAQSVGKGSFTLTDCLPSCVPDCGKKSSSPELDGFACPDLSCPKLNFQPDTCQLVEN